MNPDLAWLHSAGVRTETLTFAAQCAGRTVRSGTGLADVAGSDQHQVDVVGKRSRLAVIPASPGAVDQRAVDAVQPAKLRFEDGLKSDGLEQDRVELVEDQRRGDCPDAAPATAQLGIRQACRDQAVDLASDRRLRTAGSLDNLRDREVPLGLEIGRAEVARYRSRSRGQSPRRPGVQRRCRRAASRPPLWSHRYGSAHSK
jgi:hypothetical protein